MQQYSQKYAIVQLLETIPVGTIFSSSNWPLHVTIADTFATDWTIDQLLRQLSLLEGTYSKPVISTAKEEAFFGEKGETRVILLDKTTELAHLHQDVINVLKQGGWAPNDPQFAEDGFLPHVTIQPHAQLAIDQEVSFTSLSVIDFFPDGDPFVRKVLATIQINRPSM